MKKFMFEKTARGIRAYRLTDDPHRPLYFGYYASQAEARRAWAKGWIPAEFRDAWLHEVNRVVRP